MMSPLWRLTSFITMSDAMRSTSTGVGGFFLIRSCCWAHAANPGWKIATNNRQIRFTICGPNLAYPATLPSLRSSAQRKSRPERRLSISKLCQRLCEAEGRPARAAIGHEADPEEAQNHHRPRTRLGYRRDVRDLK